MPYDPQNLSDWQPRPRCGLTALEGTYVRLEPYDAAQHLSGLFKAVGGAANAELWRYIPLGPFLEGAHLGQMIAVTNTSHGWQTMVIRATGTDEIPGGEILGMASYMRIREDHGSAEVGCVLFGPKLQRTREATQAIYLMARHLFDDLGYRRFEWKCNEANAASKRAAVRFGFTFEGIFRNDMVMKGMNRDTAWYSMIDSEWPEIKAAFKAWLSAENFDEEGRQRARLEAYRGAL
jgi:RimJ/RimL family protein N-acetyltransferase